MCAPLTCPPALLLPGEGVGGSLAWVGHISRLSNLAVGGGGGTPAYANCLSPRLALRHHQDIAAGRILPHIRVVRPVLVAPAPAMQKIDHRQLRSWRHQAGADTRDRSSRVPAPSTGRSHPACARRQTRADDRQSPARAACIPQAAGTHPPRPASTNARDSLESRFYPQSGLAAATLG